MKDVLALEDINEKAEFLMAKNDMTEFGLREFDLQKFDMAGILNTTKRS